MKLPQTLLGALLVGITLQATSCTKKDNKDLAPKDNVKKEVNNTNNQEPCPACGMG